jgi:hypothetical protein
MSFMRFLCAFAGADLQIIDKCPRFDRIRYSSLGFIILIITILAFIFSSYAMIHIFMPRGSLSVMEGISNYVFAIAIGVCWSFIVFNFYQLLAASTGIGDGSAKLTLDEIISVTPKLFITFIFGLALSSPINVWLLHEEISQVTTENQLKSIAIFNMNLNKRYSDNLDKLYNKQVEFGGNIYELSTRLADMKKNLIVNSTVQKRKRGFSANEFEYEKNKIIEIESELIANKQNLSNAKVQTAKLRGEIIKIKNEHELDVSNSASLHSNLDKVLERHRPLYILSSIFIIAIHFLPIFIRIIWVKGPYEYMVNFQNTIVIKKYGIVPRARKIGIEWLERFTIAEKILQHTREHHFESRRDLDNKLNSWYRKEVSIIRES